MVGVYILDIREYSEETLKLLVRIIHYYRFDEDYFLCLEEAAQQMVVGLIAEEEPLLSMRALAAGLESMGEIGT